METSPPAPEGNAERGAPLSVGRVDQFQVPAVGNRPVGAGEAVELVLRYVESRVPHAERLEDPLGQELRQGPSGGAGEEHAEDVGASVVEPLLARLVEERDARQRGRPGVRTGDLPGLRRSLPQFAEQELHRGQGEVGGESVARTEGQQVGDGDRTVGGDHVVDGCGRRTDDRRCGEFRQPARHRRIEGEQPVLDQDHRGRCGHRFGEGGDPEEGVAGHRRGAFDVE